MSNYNKQQRRQIFESLVSLLSGTLPPEPAEPSARIESTIFNKSVEIVLTAMSELNLDELCDEGVPDDQLDFLFKLLVDTLVKKEVKSIRGLALKNITQLAEASKASIEKHLPDILTVLMADMADCEEDYLATCSTILSRLAALEAETVVRIGLPEIERMKSKPCKIHQAALKALIAISEGCLDKSLYESIAVQMLSFLDDANSK